MKKTQTVLVGYVSLWNLFRGTIRSRLWSRSCTGLVLALAFPLALRADPGQLAISSQIQYSTVIQGALDPVYGYIYNTAPAGSDAVNYNIYASFPYGNSSAYAGSKAADGGAGYVMLPFTFNSGLVDPGTSSVGVTATDTGTGGSLTQSGNVQVLAHGVPAFVVGGNVVQLSSAPPAQAPSSDPLAFGATGGGETFAANAPNLINDPFAPTAELDLDSITISGDHQISITLAPFMDQLASDNPTLGVPFQIDVDGSTPGTYFATIELNYSDEQDLLGADAPGSEHGYFGVIANVTADGVTGGIVVVPEPSNASLLVAGFATLLLSQRLRAKLAKAEALAKVEIR